MGGEAYTVEFECEAEQAKDLLKELTASPYGQRAIELLNDAKFLPEKPPKTHEELITEAETEEREREAHEEGLRERGRKDMMIKMLEKLRQLRGDDFVKAFEEALSMNEEGEESAKKFEEVLAKISKERDAITTSDQETNQENSSNQSITTRTEDEREPE